ncbi:MAG: D-2-hydroxyacid dehydrogenase [Lachnospiraceae bacterium]|nr:D-2-hydroxyacid dehydrogenase [Lachnospiraceae bacterium]
MKIVIMDGSAANPGDLSWDILNRFGEVTVYDVTPPSLVYERAKGAEIVLTNKTVFDAEMLSRLPEIKYIGVLATGYNVVDIPYCKEHGIVVTNVPAYSTFATAQMTVALILEFCDRVGLHNEAVMNGEWISSPQFCFFKAPIIELWNLRAHIIGFGQIGRRVAAILSSLGMKVSATPHHFTPGESCTLADGSVVEFMSVSEGLAAADIVSLHAPLTDETREIINKSSIGLMKDGALLVNCARGPLVNEQDIVDALKSGKLGGFCADVISKEPMEKSNPLFGAPNTILTPHIAWAAGETRRRLIDIAAGNIEAFLAGAPVNNVVR